MGLFSKQKSIVAAQNGKVVKLEDVKDPVFSDKVLGDGVAIVPVDSEVVAPISGTVTQIAHTSHAVGITGDDGIELLIHMGIDTVNLKGEGFTACVEQGQHVEAGQKIFEMDLQFIQSSGYDTTTPCIITNMDEVKKMSVGSDEDAKAGATKIISYTK